MLKGINANITPDLMDCLMRMGHGDELVIADANFPVTSTADHTSFGEVIYLPGFTAPDAISLITELLPLDSLSEVCALRMEIDGQPQKLGEVHAQGFEVIDAVKPQGAKTGSLERQNFYQRAKQAFGVVATTESRPFGCFILRKGVIF